MRQILYADTDRQNSPSQFRRRSTSSPPQPEPLTPSPMSSYTTWRDLTSRAPAFAAE